LKTIVLALIIGLGIGYAMAWTNPTAPPPGANVPAPVNVGGETQYKSGLLGVGSFQTFLGTYLATEGSNVGIGTTEPQRQLQIYGPLPVIGLKTQDQLGWSIYVDPSDGSLNFNRQVNGDWTGSKNKVKISSNGKIKIKGARSYIVRGGGIMRFNAIVGRISCDVWGDADCDSTFWPYDESCPSGSSVYETSYGTYAGSSASNADMARGFICIQN